MSGSEYVMMGLTVACLAVLLGYVWHLANTLTKKASNGPLEGIEVPTGVATRTAELTNVVDLPAPAGLDIVPAAAAAAAAA